MLVHAVSYLMTARCRSPAHAFARAAVDNGLLPMSRPHLREVITAFPQTARLNDSDTMALQAVSAIVCCSRSGVFCQYPMQYEGQLPPLNIVDIHSIPRSWADSLARRVSSRAYTARVELIRDRQGVHHIFYDMIVGIRTETREVWQALDLLPTAGQK